ncbi:MAG: hypothetical protein IT529_06320 [Burkholderiales bacterium]|nr:hypothetical protein [Burkholderiales bacterium]
MRRPARLERAGALTPRDRIWAAVRCFGADDNFSVAEIMVLSEQRADTVITYMDGLEKAGYVQWVGKAGITRPACRPRREFRRLWLKRDIGVEAPRVGEDGQPVTQGLGRERMWRAMRTHNGPFTWREIALHASTDDRPVAMDEVKTYLKFLHRAGYLRHLSGGGPRVPARYAFVRARDTGPRPPSVSRDKSVLDGNTGEIVLPARSAAHG